MNVWEALGIFAVFIVCVGIAACGRYFTWQYARLLSMRRLAIKLYITTGTETTALDTLSRRTRKAVEKERVDFVREREFEVGPFQAECSCPSCTRVGLHWIEIGIPPGRECIFCGYKWRHR